MLRKAIHFNFLNNSNVRTLGIKNNNLRIFFHLLEKKKKILLFILKNMQISLDKRQFAYNLIIQFSNYTTISRIRNRCIFSNRPRAIYKKFKMSRIYLKSWSLQGLLSGIQKASW